MSQAKVEERNRTACRRRTMKAAGYLGMFAVKKISPEAAIIYSTYRHYQELVAHTGKEDSSVSQLKKLGYISLILTTKLAKPLVPDIAKVGLGISSAVFECRRQNLNSRDMKFRNHNIVQSVLGFVGSSVGGMLGSYVMPNYPYVGTFIGGQLGQSLFQSLPCSQMKQDEPGVLPGLHTKYWGYGIDNDAKNILQPLRKRYERTVEHLNEIKTILTLCLQGNPSSSDYEEILKFYKETVDLYEQVNRKHNRKVARVMRAETQDKERVNFYAEELKTFLVQNYHSVIKNVMQAFEEKQKPLSDTELADTSCVANMN